MTLEEVAPRVEGWEPSRAISGACKSNLEVLPVRVSSARCSVLNSGSPRVCMCSVFFRCKQCAHGACVHCSSVGTLGTVDSADLIIHN